jgi:predicted Zn finger-like uncharacterized protein
MTIEQFRCPNCDMWYEVTRGQIPGPAQPGRFKCTVCDAEVAGLALIAMTIGGRSPCGRGMAKKRSDIANGVRTAYHVHQALEAARSLTQSKVRQSLEGIGEIAMLTISLAVVYGLFSLADVAIRALKNGLL